MIDIIGKHFSDYRIRVAAVMLVTVMAAVFWYAVNYNKEYTDNATIRCDVIDVVSELNGVIDEILFEDNSFVARSSTLLSIEDSLFKANLKRSQAELRSYEIAYRVSQEKLSLLEIELHGEIQKSQASIEAASASVESMVLTIKEAEAKLRGSQTELNFSKEEFDRDKYLFNNKTISQHSFYGSKKLYTASVAQTEAARARVQSLKSLHKVEVHKLARAQKELDIMQRSIQSRLLNARLDVDAAASLVDVAQARLDLAALNIERTRVAARRSGHVTNRRVSSGDFVEVGQPIASIVSCQERAWVEANFKETQIGRMTPGQKVNFTVDAYPGHTFSGRIDSVAGGSGSTFSVLPPENATGNFTKVVQRFPVRIAVEGNQQLEFRVGMSSEVTVFLQ